MKKFKKNAGYGDPFFGDSIFRPDKMDTLDKVPAADLLIWNVKDGWEPLCAFLDKPIPVGPIPHENKSGTDWMLNYAWKSEFARDMEKTAIKTLSLAVLKHALVALIALGVYYFTK